MEGIVPHPHWLKTVQNSLPGIRMLKVHSVVVRAIFGTRSEEEKTPPPKG